MKSMPFPSNDDTHSILPPTKANAAEMPWQKLHPTAAMPLSFEVRVGNGVVETFPYSDFRGTKLLHAGYLIIRVFGMEKYHIIVEGRNLSELAKLLSLGRVQWFGETTVRELNAPESDPCITAIKIDELTG